MEKPKTQTRKSKRVIDNKPVYEKRIVVKAGKLKRGSFFVKRTGEFAYKTLSADTVKFHGLDPNFVYGVCFNGNMTKVSKETEVCIAGVRDMHRNIEKAREFDRFLKGE